MNTRNTERQATALILTRGSGTEREVYLVARAPELRFFGGYLAFPGGVIDAADRQRDGGLEAALLSCAHRELFEESGVLVEALAERIPGDDRAALRKELLDGKRARWDEHVGDTLPALESICDITTPPFAPVRYATRFLHVPVPDGAEPDVWAGELVGGRFWKPAEALAAWRGGDELIVPPVILLLELLLDRDHEEFRAEAERCAAELRAGRLHPVRFSPGIFMAPLETRTKPPATTTNCLIVGEERLLVVDPGAVSAAELQRLFQEIDRRVAAGARLDGAVVTHHHPDHTGGLAILCQRYSVPVWGHAEALEQLAPLPTEGHAIAEGDTLPLGTAPDGSRDWQLEVFDAPGHCRDHLAFIDSRYRALIAGDLVSALSSVLIDPDEGHMATYLATLERLASLDIGTVYPGHGPAVRDGRALLERTIRHREKREQKLADALTETPQTVDQLLAAAYDDVPDSVLHLAQRSLLAGLEKLEEESRATRVGDDWRKT